MATTATIRFTRESVQRTIAAADRYNKVKQRALRDLVIDYTQRIKDEARRRVPVDTGRLKASILKRTLPTARGSTVGEVYTNTTHYAAFVEFGTGRRGAASGVTPPSGYRHGPSPGMDAQPYLIPAWEQEEPKFQKAVEAELAKL